MALKVKKKRIYDITILHPLYCCASDAKPTQEFVFHLFPAFYVSAHGWLEAIVARLFARRFTTTTATTTMTTTASLRLRRSSDQPEKSGSNPVLI